MESDLNEVFIFVHVVNAGSFTAAAKALDLPKSTVSRKVSQLEDRLAVRLLERTTRKLALTEIGEAFFEQGQQIVRDLEAAERMVGEMSTRPQGTLRLTAPVEFGESFLGPILVEFEQTYPDVTLEIDLTARFVDLVEEGYHLAIRPGPLPDSSMMARRFGEFTRSLYASPSYLERNGTPETPDDLRKHEEVLFSPIDRSGHWTLTRDGTVQEIQLQPRVRANHFSLIKDACVGGLGVGLLPAFAAREAVRSGELVAVLPGWVTPGVSLYAVYPSSRHLSAKTRAFLDLLSAAFLDEPWR